MLVDLYLLNSQTRRVKTINTVSNDVTLYYLPYIVLKDTKVLPTKITTLSQLLQMSSKSKNNQVTHFRGRVIFFGLCLFSNTPARQRLRSTRCEMAFTQKCFTLCEA